MSTKYPALPFTTFPDSIQNFVTMQDILAADGSAVKNFQDAIEAGNIALAQQYYATINNADAKFIDAKKMNALFQTCVALQQFYTTDVQPYVSTKQSEWQSIIDLFNYTGAFSATTQYYPNNWVSVAQSDNDVVLYICIVQPPIGTQPTNMTYWRQFTIRGVQGVSGDGMSFRGQWQVAEQYKADDIVAYSNAVWAATQVSTGQSPFDGSAYWQLVYQATPTIYPVQASQPIGQSTGDLWFKVVD